MYLSLILYCCIMCEVDLSFHLGTKPGSNVECRESRQALGVASTGSTRNSSTCILCAHSALWQLLSRLTYLWAGYAGCAVTGDAQTWCGCCVSRSHLGAAQPHSHGIDCEDSQASLVGRWETSLLTAAAFLHLLSSCCGLHPAAYTRLVLEMCCSPTPHPPRLFFPLIAVDAACTTFKMRYLSCWRLAPGRRCPFYPRRSPAACPCRPRRARGSEGPRPSPASGPRVPSPGSSLLLAPLPDTCTGALPLPALRLRGGWYWFALAYNSDLERDSPAPLQAARPTGAGRPAGGQLPYRLPPARGAPRSGRSRESGEARYRHGQGRTL